MDFTLFCNISLLYISAKKKSYICNSYNRILYVITMLLADEVNSRHVFNTAQCRSRPTCISCVVVVMYWKVTNIIHTRVICRAYLYCQSRVKLTFMCILCTSVYTRDERYRVNTQGSCQHNRDNCWQESWANDCFHILILASALAGRTSGLWKTQSSSPKGFLCETFGYQP